MSIFGREIFEVEQKKSNIIRWFPGVDVTDTQIWKRVIDRTGDWYIYLDPRLLEIEERANNYPFRLCWTTNKKSHFINRARMPPRPRQDPLTPPTPDITSTPAPSPALPNAPTSGPTPT